jgi:hypothetical protein
MVEIKKVTYTNNNTSGVITIPKNWLDLMKKPKFIRMEYNNGTIIMTRQE